MQKKDEIFAFISNNNITNIRNAYKISKLIETIIYETVCSFHDRCILDKFLVEKVEIEQYNLIE